MPISTESEVILVNLGFQSTKIAGGESEVIWSIGQVDRPTCENQTPILAKSMPISTESEVILVNLGFQSTKIAGSESEVIEATSWC